VNVPTDCGQELALEESPVQLAVGQHPVDRLGHT
jgi:hypothetical protein